MSLYSTKFWECEISANENAVLLLARHQVVPRHIGRKLICLLI